MKIAEFNDKRLTPLYDRFHPPRERDDYAFYLPLIMSARSVLDVGCGPGSLLHLAREAGHTGRLCGLDPAEAMLNQARRRSDVEWILGDLSTVSFDQAFDLSVMTGHAFQQLLTDDDIRQALAAIHDSLVDGGRFAFETRNPLVRGWERWLTQYRGETTDPTGVPVTATCAVEGPVEGNLVRSIMTYTSPAWDTPLVSRNTLRFVDASTLSRFLDNAGLAIEEQFGDWDQQPFTTSSPELITIARKA